MIEPAGLESMEQQRQDEWKQMERTADGYFMKVHLGESDVRNEEFMKFAIQNWFETFHERIFSSSSWSSIIAKSREIKSDYLNRFVTRLFLLQNLENENVLIHQRVESQHWGPTGECKHDTATGVGFGYHCSYTGSFN